MKAVVARERPSKLLQDVQVHGEEATGLEFRSGHAAVSAALATAPTAPARGRAPFRLSNGPVFA
jgi:hypothetical protein